MHTETSWKEYAIRTCLGTPASSYIADTTYSVQVAEFGSCQAAFERGLRDFNQLTFKTLTLQEYRSLVWYWSPTFEALRPPPIAPHNARLRVRMLLPVACARRRTVSLWASST